jgi:hypothetical protein
MSLQQVGDASHSRHDKAIAPIQALPNAPEPGDALEAFLRIAPTRLL